MKKETLKELGKAFFAIANLIGGLSIINGLFGKNSNIPQPLLSIIIFYIFISFYIAGIILLNKGANDD